jgi:hypothetical protein
MNPSYTMQMCLVFFLLITLVFGRALYYDELIEDDNTKLYSGEDEGKINKRNSYSLITCVVLEKQDLKSKLSNALHDNDDDSFNDNQSFDSYEEKKFHQRSIFTSSRPSNAISAHTRQVIIDILQKALNEGWRPNLKHYIPATRFGRHRR